MSRCVAAFHAVQVQLQYRVVSQDMPDVADFKNKLHAVELQPFLHKYDKDFAPYFDDIINIQMEAIMQNQTNPQPYVPPKKKGWIDFGFSTEL